MAKATKEESTAGEPDQVTLLKGKLDDANKTIASLEKLLDQSPTKDLQQLQSSLGETSAENDRLKRRLMQAERERIGGTVYLANQDITMDGVKITEGQALAISRVPLGNLESALRLKQVRAQVIDDEDD